MPSHQRTALAALALGLAVVLRSHLAFAQVFDRTPENIDRPGVDRPTDDIDRAPDKVDARDARPDSLPPFPSAKEAPGDEAVANAPPDEGAGANAPTWSDEHPSGIAARLAEWVVAKNDNGDLPFMIVDKLGARIFAFDAGGSLLGSAPVLLGLARGDDSDPGIGDLKLSQISADERTTPAGRFVAGFGDSNGHGTVLWVDFPDAISLHAVQSVSPDEHRQQRIQSADPEQHRISYGCINVPEIFYDEVVLTALAGGHAVVYILPDTKPIDDVFPAFASEVDGSDGAELLGQPINSASRAAERPPTPSF
jgi:hypothetical protein